MKNQTYFDSILKNILDLPLWVKQALFVEIREHLKGQTPFGSIETISKNNLLQLYTPFITSMGNKIIKERNFSNFINKLTLTNEMFSLLSMATNKARIIDICQQNSWTLSKCCKILTDCIEANLIEPISSNTLSSTVYFLAGKIRIGEYLVRTNRISVEQLDMALYSQKYTEESFGEKILLAQILINLRYITPQDYENIIFLKNYGEELYSSNFNDNIDDIEENVANIKKEILYLRQERLKLRENLSKFSDDAQTIANLLMQIDNLKKSLDELEEEKNKAKNDLNFYLNEVVTLSQENFELREQIQDK